MKITFTNKEDQNKKQEEEFLKLSPVERLIHFFTFRRKVKLFSDANVTSVPSENFLIDFTKNEPQLGK